MEGPTCPLQKTSPRYNVLPLLLAPEDTSHARSHSSALQDLVYYTCAYKSAQGIPRRASPCFTQSELWCLSLCTSLVVSTCLGGCAEWVWSRLYTQVCTFSEILKIQSRSRANLWLRCVLELCLPLHRPPPANSNMFTLKFYPRHCNQAWWEVVDVCQLPDLSIHVAVLTGLTKSRINVYAIYIESPDWNSPTSYT